MSEQQWLEANRRAVQRVPQIGLLLGGLVVAGACAFGYAAAREGLRGWQAYWVNFLFWSGLAQAGVVLAALVHLSRGRWGGSVVRLGLLQVGFLPVTVILYLGIALMAGRVLPWVKEPVPGKEWWLDLSFFLMRDGIALGVLVIVSLAFAYYALRWEAGVLSEAGIETYPKWLTRGWLGAPWERARSQQKMSWLAPLLVLCYALVYSLLGFDMIMTLDPHWYSNLFGAYYFITTIYIGLAALVVLATILRRQLGLEQSLTSKQFHDLGKLLLAFCLLSADFLWSQYLIIWYGDLPEEIKFVIHRIRHTPWSTLSYIVLFGGFVIPFIILLNRRIKEIPITLAALSLVILAVGFSERLLMVLPSLHTEEQGTFPIGLPEILISLGFAGLYGLSLLWALKRAPIVPAESFARD